MTDPERVKARGPWLLVKPERRREKTESGLYIPEGNQMERMGHSVAVVVSVDKGYWHVTPKGKSVWVEHTVKKGDRIVFRGHLKHNDIVSYQYIGDLFFLKIPDILGVIDKEAVLDLALPYDN